MKITRTTKITALFSVLAICAVEIEDIPEERWVRRRPVLLKNEFWVAGVYRQDFEDDLVFGTPNTPFHLKVSQGDTDKKIKLFNDSTEQQIYRLEDVQRPNRWLYGTIAKQRALSVEATHITVYIFKQKTGAQPTASDFEFSQI
ncbi:hypothetical protein PCANC_22495 [Puccinia coronata f. sp. avenae]|jgi:hypothetical protein|uniref:Uncharacterized protein n=1 Tax=Puccinia coronata f. sp. avenae TaxID=200324 RepID=A0A2N5SZL6_9BASI|nr:hypothetical protein PCANC_20924 [Puccinia coronata f. sp. avenae]PLW18679.1 hypothetical protein PCASD_18583 [Puccinia coronata f. sp. avenae]PLW31721.1 hypothetical protein PCANC_22495 [Puccinia coronata f. sp. avenae]